MWPDRVSNQGSLALESEAQPGSIDRVPVNSHLQDI